MYTFQKSVSKITCSIQRYYTRAYFYENIFVNFLEKCRVVRFWLETKNWWFRRISGASICRRWKMLIRLLCSVSVPSILYLSKLGNWNFCSASLSVEKRTTQIFSESTRWQFSYRHSVAAKLNTRIQDGIEYEHSRVNVLVSGHIPLVGHPLFFNSKAINEITIGVRLLVRLRRLVDLP